MLGNTEIAAMLFAQASEPDCILTVVAEQRRASHMSTLCGAQLANGVDATLLDCNNLECPSTQEIGPQPVT